MPELPEVETVRRGIAPAFEGRRIVRAELARADLRFPFPEKFAETVGGRTVTALRRRAKYLVADLDADFALIMHLGMTGSFRVERGNGTGAGAGAAAVRHPRSGRLAHDHVVFHMSGGDRLVYNDPRRFGFMTLSPLAEWQAHPLIARLGPEPTGNDLSADLLAPRFAGRAAPLKAVLLDQRVVAGLGNIYVCEALWRARLAPDRAAGTLVARTGRPTTRLRRLTDAVRAVVAEAIAAGGSSIRDYVHADGTLGYFQHSFSVYGREDEPCLRPTCRGTVRRIVQSGRSTFFCPLCQR